MVEESSEASARVDESASNARFDSYRSLADSSIMIFVAKDAVPPFRF
jgi:hypothetical protein